LSVLKAADLVAAEDTREAKKLFHAYHISSRLLSLHQHNEQYQARRIVEQAIRNQWVVAVITDAGTPGISDPGYRIVREAYATGLYVDVLPGPTAFVPALLLSNLPAERFAFEGFLPRKKGRIKRLQALTQEERTLIFYEAPHRLLKTLKDLIVHLGGNRPAAVCRELTKLHQEVQRGTLQSLYHHYAQQPSIRGEVVLVVGPPDS
jgi:16S rRNA (cytidine1402-2'-O)-methyltransferase